jgi:hypothetical protein
MASILRTTKKKAPPLLIGWREWAAFPEFKVKRIKAKIDTGAKTSALHAFNLETRRRGGVDYAEFTLHPLQKKARPEKFCAAPIVDKRWIRSSNGMVEERFIIRTLIRLGDREWPIDVSLTNRDSMGFRLLLGRDAFRKRFLIDPRASYLLGK